MAVRRCPKCRQAIVSCNDYVYCWRFDGENGDDGCHMRKKHSRSGHSQDDHEDEEDFLEWLFFEFLDFDDDDPVLVTVVDVPAAITIT
jgi:hypothetical protein